MKQSAMGFWLRILAAILLLSLNVFAQVQQDTVAKQELALEIRTGDDGWWEIPAVNGASGETGNFRRLKSWKPVSGEPPVAVIVFKIDREADLVIAHLSVRLENDKIVTAATYRLREFEAVKTEELTKFGLEPLVLKVVKTKPRFELPLPPVTPQIENKTAAVQVVSFYPDTLRSGDFRLTLRNVSTKKIIMLDLFIPSAEGHGGFGQRMSGDKNRPVILPDSVSTQPIQISDGGRMTLDGFVPETLVQRMLIIRTVVFDDGTYDGLVEPVAEFEAHRRGLDTQRRRILRILDEFKATDSEDELTTLNALKEQVYGLAKAPDASAIQELVALFPSLGTTANGFLRRSFEVGLTEGKRGFLRYINEFEELQKGAGPHVTFAEWIKQTKVSYEKR
jgi:hypothetical protein